MEKNILNVRKEDSVFPKGKRGYLVFPNDHLVPGALAEGEDFFEIELDTAGLYPAKALLGGQGPDCYRFLIACAGLEALRGAYSFSLDPDNLMHDAAFTPKVRLRDGAHGAENDGFLREYKALIASLLAPSHGYADYLEGGEDLYVKHKLLSEIAPLGTVREVADVLRLAFTALQSRLSKDSVLVGKRKYRSIRVAAIVAGCLFAALLAFAAKYYLVDLPAKERAIAMSAGFLAHDYIGVLSAASGLDAPFSKEERYMAAYAGAMTASLSDKQRAAVMQAITLNTDSLYLDYWVNMGIGDYEGALDISRRIGDAELELYGLVIYRDAVSIDMGVTGAEKAETLKGLDAQIKALDEKVSVSVDAAAGGEDE